VKNRNWPFVIGSGIFTLTFLLDLFAYAGGSLALSVLLGIGTVLVFASGIIWLIYHDDRRAHFRRGWIILPLSLFGFGLLKALGKGSIDLMPAPENMELVKNVFVSRLQIGLWLVSVLLFACFVLAGSLMKRKKI
jgi:hypothetical protein